MEPFNFWPWLIESELTVEPGEPQSLELLPALRAQYPGCVSEGVASVRLQAVPHGVDRAHWYFVFSVTDFDPAQGRLVTRQVPDIHRITEDQGDGYDFSDHPATELPREVLHAVFRPGRALLMAEVLDIFRPESLRLLQQVASLAEDAEAYKAEQEAEELGQRLTKQMGFYRDWVKLSAAELCRGVDLPALVIAHLRDSPPCGFHADEAATLWDELVSVAGTDHLLQAQFGVEVLSAVYRAFQALPRATQLAYWLLNGPEKWHMEPYETWPEPPATFEVYEMFDLEDMLRQDAGEVFGRAFDEAHAKE